MSASKHEIVLLGANISGLCMAHYLLKHTIPQLRAIDRSRQFHLTIISPNTDYYWKIAAPRVLIDEKQIPISDVFKPLSDVLKQYSSDSWQHVLGKATAVDPSSKAITVSLTDGSRSTVSYNSLIIATGAHYDSPIWSTEHGTTMQKETFATMHKNLPNVKSIIIAGGGPVGVETAGEIAVNFPKASITLYSGTSRLLGRNVKPNISAVAERQLKAAGVNVVHKVRVIDSSAGTGEAATLRFDDGSERTVDMYINGIASRKNTGFLPAEWLDEKTGGVKADKDTLRATGIGAEGVYVLGDANANSTGQSMWAADGTRPAASALAIDVLKTMDPKEKVAAIEAAAPAQRQGLFTWLLSLFGGGGAKGTGVGSKQQTFKTMDGFILVPVGKTGTGELGGWKAPGFLVQMIKGKNYLLNFATQHLSGETMAKE